MRKSVFAYASAALIAGGIIYVGIMGIDTITQFFVSTKNKLVELVTPPVV